MAKKSGPGPPYLYTTCNVGPNCKFWRKKTHSSSSNYYKRTPPAILRNLDNFPLGAFYSNFEKSQNKSS